MMPRILLALLMLPAIALGASFDCKSVSMPVERMICGNPDLSDIDETLAEIFKVELEQAKSPKRLRSTQKTWLAQRNMCADIVCIQQQYEQRIAELSCSSESAMAGSAIGANNCAYFSLRLLDRELSGLEEEYNQKTAKDAEDPARIAVALKVEQSAWRNYRSAQCAKEGNLEGGSDGWKNAFAGMCEVEETKKRIKALKNELHG